MIKIERDVTGATLQEITFPTWPNDRLRIMHTPGEVTASIVVRDGPVTDDHAVLVATIAELREIRNALTLAIDQLEHS